MTAQVKNITTTSPTFQPQLTTSVFCDVDDEDDDDDDDDVDDDDDIDNDDGDDYGAAASDGHDDDASDIQYLDENHSCNSSTIPHFIYLQGMVGTAGSRHHLQAPPRMMHRNHVHMLRRVAGGSQRVQAQHHGCTTRLAS